jgi:nicotinamide riboside transporter PnuC
MSVAFSWAITVASIVGVVLNIKHRRECFYVWACTNLSWTVIDLYYAVYSQAALQAVYFGLAIWGLIEWQRQGNR